MTFYNISNAERFFERVLACEGNVYLNEADRQPRDLKQTAEYLLSTGMAKYMGGIEQIEVRVEESGDAQKLMRFMAEATRDHRGHVVAQSA